MNEFVRAEIWPLETIGDELGSERLDRALAPVQAPVKARGLSATHVSPELPGQGQGQFNLSLMHEILATSRLAPRAFGNQAPDSGYSEIPALGTPPEEKEGHLEPLLGAGGAVGVQHDKARHRWLGPSVMNTITRRDDDDCVINGRKSFATNGALASFHIAQEAGLARNEAKRLVELLGKDVKIAAGSGASARSCASSMPSWRG